MTAKLRKTPKNHVRANDFATIADVQRIVNWNLERYTLSGRIIFPIRRLLRWLRRYIAAWDLHSSKARRWSSDLARRIKARLA